MRRAKNTYQYRGPIIKKHLIHGNILELQLITGYSQKYVLDVMAGRRYNAEILLEAIKIAKRNRRLKRIAQLRQEIKNS